MNKETYLIIDDLMREQNIDKHVLSKRTGINYNTIRGYLTSGNNIPIENLEKIADAFDVSVDYLLGRTEVKKFSETEILIKGLQKIINDLQKAKI